MGDAAADPGFQVLPWTIQAAGENRLSSQQMPSLLGKKLPSLLGNVGLAVVLAAAQDQEWQGAGWVLAPVPFLILLEGQSWGGQGA